MIDMPVSAEPTPKRSAEAEQYEHTILAAELNTLPRTASDAIPDIDLHALSPDEAIRSLDAEISHQAAAGTEVLQIIHGRGSGTLRNAVRTHLANNPLVAYFRDAEHPGKQGGVTYAALHDARRP